MKSIAASEDHSVFVQQRLKEWQRLEATPYCDRGLCAKYVSRASKNTSIYCYLPIPRPKKKRVRYFFIAKEPSASWATDQKDAVKQVKQGTIMNFLPEKGSKGLIIFYLAVMEYLKGQPYLTDLSKCALHTTSVRAEKKKHTLERYENCFPLLEAELKAYANNETSFISVGAEVGSEELNAALANRHITLRPIPHYSIQLNCSKEIIKLTRTNRSSIEKEIRAGLRVLPAWYLRQFDVHPAITHKKLSHDIAAKNFNVTDSDVLLYRIYKYLFQDLSKKSGLSE